jgi:hypothetical protein
MLVLSTQFAKDFFNDIQHGQIACPKMSAFTIDRYLHSTEVCIVNLLFGNMNMREHIK